MHDVLSLFYFVKEGDEQRGRTRKAQSFLWSTEGRCCRSQTCCSASWLPFIPWEPDISHWMISPSVLTSLLGGGRNSSTYFFIRASGYRRNARALPQQGGSYAWWRRGAEPCKVMVTVISQSKCVMSEGKWIMDLQKEKEKTHRPTFFLFPVQPARPCHWGYSSTKTLNTQKRSKRAFQKCTLEKSNTEKC